MHDNELIIEILHQIQESAQKVVQRFQTISKPNDFTDTSAGMEKMDAICMMLIVIGESLKNLDKETDNDLLSLTPLSFDQVGGSFWSGRTGCIETLLKYYTPPQSSI